jgi:Ras family
MLPSLIGMESASCIYGQRPASTGAGPAFSPLLTGRNQEATKATHRLDRTRQTCLLPDIESQFSGGKTWAKQRCVCLQVSNRLSGTILLIVAKLIKEEFDHDAHTPSGEDCWQISVQLDDSWRHVEIWDIGGQLEVLQLQLIDNAEEFVVVYDTTSRSSFQRVVYFL